MREIHFKCPVCGIKDSLIEELYNVDAYKSAMSISPDVLYTGYEVITKDIHSNAVYKCLNCGSTLINDDGSLVETIFQLYYWLEARGMLGEDDGED